MKVLKCSFEVQYTNGHVFFTSYFQQKLWSLGHQELWTLCKQL